MASEKEELFFYKSTVNYVVSVRMHMRDTTGKVLTQNDPYAVIKESDLRDFKRANKIAIKEGLIMETKEPNWDEDTPNGLDREKAAEIVKNVFALKKALAEFTAETPVRTLLEEAQEQNRPKKTIELIETRLTEIVGDTEKPEDMMGVY